MPTTYKTIVNKAIRGFNEIQESLASFTDLSLNGITTEGGLSVGSMTPTDMANQIKKLASIKDASGNFISGKISYIGSPTVAITPTFTKSGSKITVSTVGSYNVSGYYERIDFTTNSSANTYTIPNATVSNGTGTATLTVAESTSAISGKTNISGAAGDPQTGTTISTPYYYAFSISSTGSGSLECTSDGYISTGKVGGVTISANGLYYVPITAGSVTISGGGLSGGKLTASNYIGTPTVSITLSEGSIASITNTKPTSGFYLTVNAESSSLNGNITVSREAVIRDAVTEKRTAGYITSKDATTVIAKDSTTIGKEVLNPSVNIKSGSKTAYITIPEVTPAFDGGTLTKGAAAGGGLGVAVASGIGLTTDTGSGIYFLISKSQFSQTVTRGNVLYNGAVNGYVSKADNTVALSSGSITVVSGSDSIVRYVNSITIPSGKTFPAITNNGTITAITNAGTLNITSNDGTVNYINWKITKDSSGNLTFKYM